MAQAAVLTVNPHPYGSDNTQREQIVYGKVTFTGSGGYTTGGVPLNWGTMVDGTTGGRFQPQVSSSQTNPFIVYFQALDGSLVQYNYFAASNTLFAQTAGAQLASATTLTGVIAFEAHFARGY